MKASKHSSVQKLLDAIVKEMEDSGAWSSTPPSNEAFENMGPFGMNTLSYEQWLQYVFIPRVRELIGTKGPWPADSSVGTQALRNFDGVPERAKLTELLCQFDDVFTP